jgi:hypothetical protein
MHGSTKRPLFLKYLFEAQQGASRHGTTTSWLRVYPPKQFEISKFISTQLNLLILNQCASYDIYNALERTLTLRRAVCDAL